MHYFKYIGTKIGIHSITYVRFVLHFTLCCYLLGQKVRQLKGDASNVLDATFKLFCVSVRECIENRNNLNVKQHAARCTVNEGKRVLFKNGCKRVVERWVTRRRSCDS